MKRKDIKELAIASFSKTAINEKITFEITRRLNRHDLKTYIRELKAIEKRQNVMIVLPDIKIYDKSDKLFDKLFSGYTISYSEDPTLLLGSRVQHNDMIYDVSLKKSLETLADEVEQSYE